MGVDKQFWTYLGGGTTVALVFAGAVEVIGLPGVDLCHEYRDDPTGSVSFNSNSHIFSSKQPVSGSDARNSRVCLVDASTLEEGESYRYYGGALVIDGDVPKEADISVENGIVVIKGDLDIGAKVKAQVPEIWRAETSVGINSRMKLCPGVSPNSMMGLCTQSQRVFSGYQYPDSDYAAVTVLGDISYGATVVSNKGVYTDSEHSNRGTIYFRNHATDRRVGSTDFSVPEFHAD